MYPGIRPPLRRWRSTTHAVVPPAELESLGLRHAEKRDLCDFANDDSTSLKAATHDVSSGELGASAPFAMSAPSMVLFACDDAFEVMCPSNTPKHARRSPESSSSSSSSQASSLSETPLAPCVLAFAARRSLRRNAVMVCTSGSASHLSSFFSTAAWKGAERLVRRIGVRRGEDAFSRGIGLATGSWYLDGETTSTSASVGAGAVPSCDCRHRVAGSPRPQAASSPCWTNDRKSKMVVNHV